MITMSAGQRDWRVRSYASYRQSPIDYVQAPRADASLVGRAALRTLTRPPSPLE